MTHWITSSTNADRGWTEYAAECDEPEGARCRLVCTDRDCEGYGHVEQVGDQAFHVHHTWPEGVPNRMPMVDDGQCNWVTWMMEDPSLIQESCEDGAVVGRAAVIPTWQDESPTFKVIPDDGHVGIYWSDDGVMLMCSRPECMVTYDWHGARKWHWSQEIVPPAGTGRQYPLLPSHIEKVWWEHLATHVQP